MAISETIKIGLNRELVLIGSWS